MTRRGGYCDYLMNLLNQFASGFIGGFGAGLVLWFVVLFVVAVDSGTFGSEFRVGFRAFFGVR